MKRFFALLAAFFLLLSGCTSTAPAADIAATTLPVYEFTTRLCQGTNLSVTQLVTESVSCLHDYTLNIRQARAAEAADLIVISGGGLEDFMADILSYKAVIDSAEGIELLECHHDHDHGAEHQHEEDAHIWLSPACALIMAQNICKGLCARYPQNKEAFEANLISLTADIEAVQAYGESQLSHLSCRELITFHDGFRYLTDAFHLTILEAIEEESGSEASAHELIALIDLVRSHDLKAIFTERSGSVSAAGIIAGETGAAIYHLDMAINSDSWFTAMYHNIDTLKEALE